jgi:uncharacterized protein
MSNRLAGETSPYLLQHADNPVDWYPWGEEALEKARREDKPIFLSIGYAACHWCHVMAHESFEDAETAALLNEGFVNIKVDREERPDLDYIYMAAVQALTGRGGWPMSVFLTPEGKPFFGGTYFPLKPRYGMTPFTDVLAKILDAWQNRREEVEHSGDQLLEWLRREPGAPGAEEEELDEGTLRAAISSLSNAYDSQHGGWGGAPKFPQPMIIEFLLRYSVSTGSQNALRMAVDTLQSMARGGMYDQLGGGFHRYSVDAQWLVPHFEKMLYDNAQLARVYLHAWQLTGEPVFRTITQETLDYVLREMTDPSGGWYASQDADSEGEEGKFFVWTPEEIREVLGDDVEEFMRVYGVTSEGNFEGQNILSLVGTPEERESLAPARQKLLARRETRVHPARDDKVLTAWNGLMLAAMAEAGRVLDNDRYREAAERNAAFVLRELRQADGRLLRTWRAGQARLNGYLEDYSYLIEGLLELYQTTFEPRWFVAVRELADAMIDHFQAPESGFFDTSDDHEALIIRPRDLQDNATPSGNAMAITVLFKLAGLTKNQQYMDIARDALAPMQLMMTQYPLGFGQWLQALTYILSQPNEIAIVGEPEDSDTQALLKIVRGGYRPFQIVALAEPSVQPSEVPLLQGRGLVNGRATVYVCRDFVCQTPLTDPEKLRVRLE